MLPNNRPIENGTYCCYRHCSETYHASRVPWNRAIRMGRSTTGLRTALRKKRLVSTITEVKKRLSCQHFFSFTGGKLGGTVQYNLFSSCFSAYFSASKARRSVVFADGAASNFAKSLSSSIPFSDNPSLFDVSAVRGVASSVAKQKKPCYQQFYDPMFPFVAFIPMTDEDGFNASNAFCFEDCSEVKNRSTCSTGFFSIVSGLQPQCVTK